MSTNVNLELAQIISHFVRRWQIEVTFAETRAHLGVETQRQWNDKAITRTTPSLLGLYSLVTLWACDLLGQGAQPYAAAWYKKTDFTFSDAISAVRGTESGHLSTMPARPGHTQNPNRTPQAYDTGALLRCIMYKVELRER